MGEVWLAPTFVDGRRFASLFAARLPRDLELRAIDLGFRAGSRIVAMDAACTAPRGGTCHAAAGLPRLRRGGSAFGFQLWSLAQLEEEGWTLLGEVHPPRAQHARHPLATCRPSNPFRPLNLTQVNKWVAVSSARVRSIMALRRNGSASLEVELRGAPGELIALAFAPPATTLPQTTTSGAGWRPAVVECYVPRHGKLRVHVPERTCTYKSDSESDRL